MAGTLQLFEAYANLEEKTVTPEQRGWLHCLTALCNRTAFYTLRSALEHIEQRDLKSLQRDPSYLRSLTEHESREEARLTQEISQLYAGFGLRAPYWPAFQKNARREAECGQF